MRSTGRTNRVAPWRDCELPANLSDWISQEMLIRLILNAVETVEDGRIDRALHDREIAPLLPRETLTLLIYCYAVGIHGSHEIADRLRHDALLRYLTIGKKPRAEYLRRFRNKNRELIAGCLGRVCCAVGRIHLAGRGVPLVLSARLAGTSLKRFETLAELHCLCEARQRLTRAELADGLWWETSAGGAGLFPRL